MKKIQAFCDSQMDDKNIRAVNIQIRQNEEEVFSYRWGKYSKSGRLINESTMFGIGSISKMFTTVAIMLLQESGKLQLDQPIAELLSEFTMQDERYKKITVRMLLNHSAGFYGNAARGKYTLEPNRDYLAQVLAFMKVSKLKADPGKFSVYCNDGFAIAEALIEEVSHESYADFVTENILEPLNMNDTAFPEQELREGRIVLAKYNEENDYPQEYVNGIGSGGIYSTAQDLCVFMESFYQGKLLNQTSLEEINHLQIGQGLIVEKDTNMHYGLGWDTIDLDTLGIFGVKAMAKSGSTYGFGSYAVVCPELKLSAAIVMSATEAKPSLLLKQVLFQVMQHLGYTYTLNALPKPKTTSMIEGYYGNNEHFMRIQGKENQLIIEDLNEKKQFTFIKKQEGYFSEESFYSMKHPWIYFKEEEKQIYLVVEYDNLAVLGLRQRVIYLQKLDVKEEIRSDVANKTYIMDNEFPTQRCLGYLPMILTIRQVGNWLITPYPLEIKENYLALPVIEIPGDYSREMYPLKSDETGFQLGQYHYSPINSLKKIHTADLMIEKGKTHWFLGSNELDSLKMDGWGRCIMIDKLGKIVFDSALSYSMPEDLETLLIGFTGKEKTKVNITVES